MNKLLASFNPSRERIRSTLSRSSVRLSVTFVFLYTIQVSGLYDVTSIINLDLFLSMAISLLIISLSLHFSWGRLRDRLTKIRFLPSLKHDSRRD